jgi:CheY-like chemotaxis protein
LSTLQQIPPELWEMPPRVADSTRSRPSSGETALALQSARDEAQRANQTKSFFLATMSHEIRTPLSGLIGIAEGLNRSPLNDTQRKHVATLIHTAESMLRLINDILDLSKVESGTIELELLPFTLSSVAEEALALVVPLAERKGLSVRLELIEGLSPTVRGDAGRLRQVLLNLLSNAVRFTDHGEVVLRIEPDGDTTRFVVQDTGIGISSEALSRIFQPFVQAERSTSRTHGGTGLGLAISSKLVGCMGGVLSATSTPGQGSTFSFALPLMAAGPLPVSHSSNGDETVQQRLGRSLHILVAEDNPVNQQVLTMLLERLGCTWEVAENGQEAVLRVSEKKFDIVLMDLQMPGMDGLRATRMIRMAEGEGARLPIVACTANAMQGERDRCLTAGMDDYLTKPVRSRQLLDCFTRLFGGTGRSVSPRSLQIRDHWRSRLESMGFDSAAILKLATSFCESVPARLQVLRRAFENRDAEELRLAAHTLKSSLNIFGADAAAQAAGELERLAQSNNFGQAEEYVLHVEADTRALLSEVGQCIHA